MEKREKEKDPVTYRTYCRVLQGFVSIEVATQKLYFITWFQIAICKQNWRCACNCLSAFACVMWMNVTMVCVCLWTRPHVCEFVLFSMQLVLLSSVLYIRKWPARVLSPFFDTSVYRAPVRTQPLLGTSHPCVSPPPSPPPSPSAYPACPVSPGNAPPPFLPPSLPAHPPSLLSGPLSLLCLLPLSIYLLGWKSQWGSTCEGAFPMCIIVCVCVCGLALMWLCVYMRLCLCKCVFVYVIKILLTLGASCVRASIETEQVGSCYYSPANHSFLWVTDWVRQRAADIQTTHC